MQRDSNMGGRVQGRAHQPLSHRRSSIQRVACWTVSAEPNERISVKSIRQENLLKMRLLSFREKDWNASKCVFSGSFSFWERSSRLFEEGDHILLYWKDSNGLIQIEREREQTSDRERGRERDRKKEYEKGWAEKNTKLQPLKEPATWWKCWNARIKMQECLGAP